MAHVYNYIYIYFSLTLSLSLWRPDGLPSPFADSIFSVLYSHWNTNDICAFYTKKRNKMNDRNFFLSSYLFTSSFFFFFFYSFQYSFPPRTFYSSYFFFILQRLFFQYYASDKAKSLSRSYIVWPIATPEVNHCFAQIERSWLRQQHTQRNPARLSPYQVQINQAKFVKFSCRTTRAIQGSIAIPPFLYPWWRYIDEKRTKRRRVFRFQDWRKGKRSIIVIIIKTIKT